MTRRFELFLQLPGAAVKLFGRLLRRLTVRIGRRNLLSATAALLTLLLVSLTAGWWESTAMTRAQAYYTTGEFNASAALFHSDDDPRARYNAANALYRAGRYEEALGLYRPQSDTDPLFAAALWYNRGNALVRLKEFEKAREAYAAALALHFDDAALENMLHILDAESQDHMLTGRQEGKKRAQEQETQTGERHDGKRKEGGGNERQNTAERSRGAGSQGKKVERDSALEFTNRGKNRLSSKQYELINQRSVHETKPW